MRSAAKRYGKAEGSRSRTRICGAEASSERSRSSAAGSTERSPTTAFTRVGKKVMRAATSIFGQSPKPNQIVNSG